MPEGNGVAVLLGSTVVVGVSMAILGVESGPAPGAILVGLVVAGLVVWASVRWHEAHPGRPFSERELDMARDRDAESWRHEAEPPARAGPDLRRSAVATSVL